MDFKFGAEDASFEAAGREAGVRALVDEFYEIMDKDPNYSELRSMHQDDLEESIDKLTRFLCGWLGGPRLYREKYGQISIPQAHQIFNVNEDQKGQWLGCMSQAISRQNFSPEFAEYLITQLRVPAERIVAVGKNSAK